MSLLTTEIEKKNSSLLAIKFKLLKALTSPSILCKKNVAEWRVKTASDILERSESKKLLRLPNVRSSRIIADRMKILSTSFRLSSIIHWFIGGSEK